MNIHALFHVAFEGLGSIEPWVQARGHHLTQTHLYCNDSLPDPESVDFLVIMGGPMSVNDSHQFPWLMSELAFVQSFLKTGKPILGICLGAQMIAKALGSSIYANSQRELGWFPIQTIPESLPPEWVGIWPTISIVFHWHGETFDLPAGAQRLCYSQACQNQAFLYNNNVLGLQFHFEMTAQTIESMYVHSAQDLDPPGPYVQSTRDYSMESLYLEPNQACLWALLDKLAHQAHA